MRFELIKLIGEVITIIFIIFDASMTIYHLIRVLRATNNTEKIINMLWVIIFMLLLILLL
jgi:hypothetical protein